MPALRFLGNGSGLTDNHTNSFYINNRNDIIFIDMSLVHYDKIKRLLNRKHTKVYVLITHMHDDHSSGIGLVAQYMYYVLGEKLDIVVPETLKNDIYTEFNIKGIDKNIVDVHTLNIGRPQYSLYDLGIVTVIPTTHAPELIGKCFGYKLEIDSSSIVYTGDTCNLKDFIDYCTPGTELYVDTSYKYGRVHLKYDDIKDELLKLVDNGVTVYMMHIDDIMGLENVKDPRLKVVSTI